MGVNNRLDKNIEETNGRLQNLEDKINDLSLHNSDVQSTLKAILRQLGQSFEN